MSESWQTWAKLGLVVVGYALFGPLGGIAAGYLGSVLWPTDYDLDMPSVGEWEMQSSAIGIPIPIVFGTTKLPGNIIWMGPVQAHNVKSSSGGGKGGGGSQTSKEVSYTRSFLISICEGPADITKAWKDKTEIPTWHFTSWNGVGNSGLPLLIDEDHASYKNLCLAYFEDYDLGNSQRIPNFIFEVASQYHSETPGKIRIYTLDQLQAMNDDLDGDYELMSSLDASETENWNGGEGWKPIGTFSTSDPFTGSFEGHGYEIKNLHINRPGVTEHRQAFFGYTYNAVINNVQLTDVDITVGGGWAAALISAPLGTALVKTVVTNCFVSGEIRGFASQSGGMFGGDGGGAEVSAYRCYSTVNLTSTSVSNCGGFIGTAGSSYFEDCYCTGILDFDNMTSYNGGFVGQSNAGSEYKYCYSIGSTPAGRTVPAMNGGFTGNDYGATFTDCFWDTETSGHDDPDGFGGTPAGLTGYISADMKLEATYTNWDFATPIWIIEETLTRPYLNPDIIVASIEPFDLNFAYMIKLLLINEKCAGYSEDDLITEDFDSIIAYCEANNIEGSLAITQQRPLPDWITYICSHFQGYFYEIGGKIGLNCYRDQASVLSITRDDLIKEGDTPPIQVTKRAYSATFNRVEAAWTDRATGYKTAVVPAFDRVDQRESGQVRTKILDLKAIHNKELATKMAWRVFIDQIYRFGQYAFKLGYKSMLLEIGDVIDVTDGHLFTAKRMRVIAIEEEENGRKALISAVEDISGLYPTITYETQESETVVDPAIVLEDGTIAFREDIFSTKLHLSITPSGTQCNGFYIYRSYDDESYSLLGRATIEGVTGGDANSTGTILSNLPAHPTIVHRKDEAFDVTIGTVTDLSTAITDDDFFNYRNLAKIGNEIIAYKNCVESSVAGTWRVSNLIRGLYGTDPVAHVPAEVFNTLDFDFDYDIQESDIGKTIYFKVVSFYATETQLISEVSAQSYVVSGKSFKPLPVSLMRINGREGLSTYKTEDVIIDWYFCSKTSGWGRGGYGDALWGAYTKDPRLEQLKVELIEEDGTPILDATYQLALYTEPIQLQILEADRSGKNPIQIVVTPGSALLGDDPRDILIEKI